MRLYKIRFWKRIENENIMVSKLIGDSWFNNNQSRNNSAFLIKKKALY